MTDYTWEHLVRLYGQQGAQHLIQAGSISPYQNQLSQMQELQRQQMNGLAQQQFGLGQSLTGLLDRSPPQTYTAPPLETGTKVEDLIGWRVWIVTDSGMLKSFAVGSIWLPGQPMTGEPGDHDSVGVWAFKSKDSAIAKLSGHNAAAGSVKLWGQVVEHEHGYRAQFARIVSIDCVSLPGKFPWDRSQVRALKWLRQTYGVET